MEKREDSDTEIAEKTQGNVAVGAAAADLSNDDTARPWSDGLLQRLPIIGFICLTLVLGIMAALIAILIVSNNKRVDSWCTSNYTFRGEQRTFRLTVSVWISILSLAANKLIGVVFAEAVTIAWWAAAIEGRTIRQLHSDWESGRSVFSAVLSLFRRRPFISRTVIASIACAFFSVHGILFQRASIAEATTIAQQSKVTAKLAQQFPPWWFGDENDNSGSFSNILEDYNSNQPIVFDIDGCGSQSSNATTTCNAALRGIGFSYDCKVESERFVFWDLQKPSDLNETQQTELEEGVTEWSVDILHVTFDLAFVEGDESEWYNLTVIHKNSTGCRTSLTRRTCAMKPAIVEYPVKVVQGETVLEQPREKITNSGKWYTDPVKSILKKPKLYGPQNALVQRDPYGAAYIKDSLQNMFGSSYTLHNILTSTTKDDGKEGLMSAIAEVAVRKFSGPLSVLFRERPETKSSNLTVDTCDITFRDPFPYLVNNIREIMFRSAVAIGKDKTKATDSPVTFESYASSVTDETAMTFEVTTVYKTNNGFVIAGAVLMILCVLAISPTFWGFWHLGRKMTLSPLEIAKALRGPAPEPEAVSAQPQTSVLDKVVDHKKDGTNAPTEELVSLLGDIKVKYGEVAPQKLGFAVEDEVAKPRSGRIYH